MKYQVIIISNDNKVIMETALIGSKEKMNDLGNSFFNIIKSLEPEKYINSRPALKQIES